MEVLIEVLSYIPAIIKSVPVPFAIVKVPADKITLPPARMVV
jgi:hypothetical protein